MTLPFETARISPKHLNRRSFIGGSDARIIMGIDRPSDVLDRYSDLRIATLGNSTRV
jgi:predicted phage-related endonuclease